MTTSGHIKRSGDLDGEGWCWLEDGTNISFGMKIFTPDECAEAVLARVARAGEQREAVSVCRGSFVVDIMRALYVWKWSEEMKWLILSVYDSCVNCLGNRFNEWHFFFTLFDKYRQLSVSTCDLLL